MVTSRKARTGKPPRSTSSFRMAVISCLHVTATGIHISQLDGSETRRLLDYAATVYAYASTGHLLFVRQGTLFAQNFDPVRLELTGNPFQVTESTSTASGCGGVGVGCRPRRLPHNHGRRRKAVRMVRSLRQGDLQGGGTCDWRNSITHRFHRTAAVLPSNVRGNQVWILDLGTGVFSRFVFGRSAIQPRWSPDGRRIVFSSNR